jgi:hypothetical protein
VGSAGLFLSASISASSSLIFLADSEAGLDGVVVLKSYETKRNQDVLRTYGAFDRTAGLVLGPRRLAADATFPARLDVAVVPLAAGFAPAVELIGGFAADGASDERDFTSGALFSALVAVREDARVDDLGPVEEAKAGFLSDAALVAVFGAIDERLATEDVEPVIRRDMPLAAVVFLFSSPDVWDAFPAS